MEVEGGIIEHYEVTGTDDASQFRGYIMYMKYNFTFLGIPAAGIKKLWIDFYN